MRRLLDVLSAIAPIAHFTVWPSLDASGDRQTTPPIIWWTYQNPSEATAEFLHQAVNNFQGQIAWQLLTTGRRWILMPARIREYAELHECNGDLIAAAALEDEEPEVGERANAEIRQLADHIARCKGDTRERLATG